MLSHVKRLAVNIIKGYASLPKDDIGRSISLESKKYFVFRRLSVKQKIHHNPAVFRVRFRFRNLPVSINKILSGIPTPFLIGMKGFNEKYWTISSDGEFQGIYQWGSEQRAKNYPNSFIFKLMTKRAKPNTINYEIVMDTNIKDYIEDHKK